MHAFCEPHHVFTCRGARRHVMRRRTSQGDWWVTLECRANCCQDQRHHARTCGTSQTSTHSRCNASPRQRSLPFDFIDRISFRRSTAMAHLSDKPFASIESAQEFIALLFDTVAEAKHDVEAD